MVSVPLCNITKNNIILPTNISVKQICRDNMILMCKYILITKKHIKSMQKEQNYKIIKIKQIPPDNNIIIPEVFIKIVFLYLSQHTSHRGSNVTISVFRVETLL